MHCVKFRILGAFRHPASGLTSEEAWRHPNAFDISLYRSQWAYSGTWANDVFCVTTKHAQQT